MTREMEAQLAREFAQRRENNEHERDERIDEVTQKDPQIARLQNELRRRFAKSTGEMMANPAMAKALSEALKEDVLGIQKQIRERLRGLGLSESYMDIRYRCERCKDTGFLGDFGQQMCSCYRQRRMELMRRDANLTGSEGQRFESFDENVFPEGEQRTRALNAKKLCEKYADTLTEKGGMLNLILMGKSGLGKTFLLNCVAERAIERGVSAMAMTAFHMLAAMRDYHFGQIGEDALLNQMINCELLLIDDLGTEPMLRNITVEYLFMLLNERMNAKRHTVIATNLSPEEIQERYNERVVSRLMDRQNGAFIRLTGSDLRFRGQNG